MKYIVKRLKFTALIVKYPYIYFLFLGLRIRWTPLQKTIMRKSFKMFIKNKKALRKQECLDFLTKHRSNFEGVDWLRVKTFIYNESKSLLDD